MAFATRPLPALFVATVLAAALTNCPGCGPKKISSDIDIDKSKSDDALADEFRADPVAMLSKGLDWYGGNVKDYTCVLYKKERVQPGEKDFRPEQKLECKFREQPYSVFTHTVVNPRGAFKALYVEGQWDNKMKATASVLGFPVTVTVDPRGPEARKETLRFIDQFGFKRSLTTIVNAIRTARAENIWKGEVIGSGKVGDREVIILESRITEQTPTGRFDLPHIRVFLDREWRLPIGVFGWDAQGVARAEYQIKEIKFNVGLTDEDFTLKANGM